jgi:ParB-like chromosome segregation protein Spo0J
MNPADKVQKWAIDKLIPYARNARTHSDEQVAQIAASIKEWGWTTPVLVDEDGGIIAGHGRTLAAQKLKMTEVPVMMAKGWSDAKKRAYVLADNKLALNAGWDNEMLALELAEIGELGFDLELIGFDLQEIATILDDQNEIEEPESVDYKEMFNIIVECSNEEEQEKIFNRLDTEGYKCRVQSL